MLDLESAIKHCEEVAEENEKSLRGWKECIKRGTVGWSDFDKEKVDTSITRCSKCAEEHRQLAEWLKDYKRLKEQELSCGDLIRREDAINAVSEALEHTVVENEDVAKKMINKLPPVTPQPEIIRCKDCKYWRKHKYA